MTLIYYRMPPRHGSPLGQGGRQAVSHRPSDLATTSQFLDQDYPETTFVMLTFTT